MAVFDRMQRRGSPGISAPGRKGRPPCALLVLGLILCGAVRAAEPAIAVIVQANAAARAYTSDEVASIFRRRLRIGPNGAPLVPVNLPLNHPLREAISRFLYGIEPEDMEAYWNERYFHGISPPYVVGSIEAMLRFVATTPGAIGYVLDCRADDRVTTVARLAIADPDPDLEALCADGAGLGIRHLQTKLAQ